ncbi:MAG: MarR family winged helix-turn-helix transcriptional regulator [Burkholderiales bacterium]
MANDATRTDGEPMTDADYVRLAAFRQALRSFLNFSESAASRIGLTGQQYQALLVVRATPPSSERTVSELARQLLIKHHSAVGLVDRLVDQEYLVRKPSRKDARKVELRLTAKGTRVLGRLADMHRHELAHAGPQLTALLAQIAHPAKPGTAP